MHFEIKIQIQILIFTYFHLYGQQHLGKAPQAHGKMSKQDKSCLSPHTALHCTRVQQVWWYDAHASHIILFPNIFPRVIWITGKGDGFELYWWSHQIDPSPLAHRWGLARMGESSLLIKLEGAPSLHPHKHQPLLNTQTGHKWINCPKKRPSQLTFI